MPQSDRPRLADIPAALRLLTRLPMPADPAPTRAASAWAWPFAGLVVGTLAAGLGAAAAPLGGGVAAAVVLGVQAILTGAMHEDGLADCADGFWGGWDRARRLEIMKDSAIGTYGVLALLVTGLMRWSALAVILEAGHWTALIGIAALGRVPMAVVMALLPNARGKGLAQSVGRPGLGTVALGLVLGLGAAFVFAGAAGFGAASAMAATTGLVIVIAWVKIGGQTGDVLGASQLLGETAALVVLAAVIH